ncbi:MAG: hypothetical protein Q9217_000909 [Psora testacea]
MSPRSASNGFHRNGHTIRQMPLSYENAESQTSALHLVLTLFPEWGQGEGKVEFIPFKDGITNTLIKAVKQRPGATEEQLDKEAVLLRAYGNGTEVLIDRDRETTSHSLLAQHGLAPPLLARFQNGLIYKFIRGQVCSPSDLQREHIWRGVARRLAQWHALLPIVADGMKAVIKDDEDIALAQPPLTSPGALDKINAITPGKPVPNIWTVMQKWIFALPAGTKAELDQKATLQRELARSATELGNTPGLGSNGLVFAHCDLLSGNIIIQPRHRSEQDPTIAPVSFIDYEYATPSPVAFDLVNHFSEWGGFDCDYNVLPTRSTRRAFIEEYMASYASHTHIDPSVDYVARIFHEVDLFRGIPGLYWGVWALIQATISQIDFDYAFYAKVRLGEYFDWRAEQDGSRAKAGIAMPLRERRWAEE